MVAIRLISLLLVLGFAAPTWASIIVDGRIVEAYERHEGTTKDGRGTPSRGRRAKSSQ